MISLSLTPPQIVEKVVHTQVPVHREEHFTTPVYTQQMMQQPCAPVAPCGYGAPMTAAPSAMRPMSCCSRPF